MATACDQCIYWMPTEYVNVCKMSRLTISSVLWTIVKTKKIPLEHWTLFNWYLPTLCSITWLSFVLNAYNSSLNSMTIELHVLHQVVYSVFHHSFDSPVILIECNSICKNDASIHLMIEQCNFNAFDDLSWWQSVSIFPHFSPFQYGFSLFSIFFIQFESRMWFSLNLCLFGVYCYFHIIIARCVCKLRTIRASTFCIVDSYSSHWTMKQSHYIQIYKCVLFNVSTICDPNWGTSFEFELEQWTVNTVTESRHFCSVHKFIRHIFFRLLLLLSSSSFHFVHCSNATLILFHSLDPYALNSFEMFINRCCSFVSFCFCVEPIRSWHIFLLIFFCFVFKMIFYNAVAGNLFIVRWDAEEECDDLFLFVLFFHRRHNRWTSYPSKFSHLKSKWIIIMCILNFFCRNFSILITPTELLPSIFQDNPTKLIDVLFVDDNWPLNSYFLNQCMHIPFIYRIAVMMQLLFLFNFSIANGFDLLPHLSWQCSSSFYRTTFYMRSLDQVKWFWWWFHRWNKSLKISTTTECTQWDIVNR